MSDKPISSHAACLKRNRYGAWYRSAPPSPDPRPGAHYDYAPAPEEVLRRARWMADRCTAYEVPLAAAALRFPLRHPAVTGVVVGARTPAEITDDLALAATEIPTALWAELDQEARSAERPPSR